jgi:carotenoid cleavage dioxygenase-like enzyme
MPFLDRCLQASAEDDGYLITLLFNGHTRKSECLILDARSVSRGEAESGNSGRKGLCHGMGSMCD